MTRAFDQIKDMPLEARPYGYFVVDTRPLKDTGEAGQIARFELMLVFPDTTEVLFYGHVSNANRIKKVYSLEVYDSEDCSRLIAMSEVSYLDHAASTTTFESVYPDWRFAGFGAEIVKVLHPMILDTIMGVLSGKNDDGWRRLCLAEDYIVWIHKCVQISPQEVAKKSAKAFKLDPFRVV